MKIKLFGNHVLVKRIQSDRSDGGILMPDKWSQSKIRGIVVEVGNGKRKYSNSSEFIRPDLEIGDVIVCSKFDGTILKIDGAEYWLLREDEILAVLQDEK
jgi:chaperonin GroES